MCNCSNITSEYQYTDEDGNKIYKDIARSCEVDLDLHRYQCTVCNEIGYYSHAAKLYYEHGVESNILGLNHSK